MEHPFKIGFSFGLTSGIITTLGLMVGLDAGTHSRLAVVGGILTIAVADAFSDALGIHTSEESEGRHSERLIWKATLYTFLAKFVVAMTFVIPLLLFQLPTAVVVNVVWGLLLLGVFNFLMARWERASPMKVVSHHMAIALLVVTITYYLGNLIAATFG